MPQFAIALVLPPVSLIILAGVLAALCLGFAQRAARRRRLIDCLPTCKTTGVFVGVVELKGAAETERPLTSFLAEEPCVLYSWSIEEHWSRTVTETYTDNQGKTQTRTRHESGWTSVGHGGEEDAFYVQDDCGTVLVKPDGAKIEPATILSATCGPSDPLYYGKGPRAAICDSDHERRWVHPANGCDYPARRRGAVSQNVVQSPFSR